MSSRGTIADAMATERRNTRGSAPLGCDEELAIAVAAGDGRGHDVGDAPAARPDEGGDVLADRGMNEGIAHDAFLCVTSAGFELRLDQRQEMPGVRASANAAGRTSLSEMKLVSTTMKSGCSTSRVGSRPRMSVASMDTISVRARRLGCSWPRPTSTA